MSTKNILLFFIAGLMACIVNGQSESLSIYDKYQGNDSEKVYVGVNTTLLFTGEYLYYAVFCLNDKTKQPSDISSLAYVHLVSEDGTTVFKHKIGLKNSKGQGEFFVPTSVPSGNYRLIGFTKWMLNGSQDLFFHEDISIINPYQSNQSAILDSGMKSNEYVSTYSSDERAEKDKRFVLETDKREYAKRAKVTLNIKNFRGASGYGNYLLSVRRKSEFKTQLLGKDPIKFIEQYSVLTQGKLPKYQNINHLPEVLGERVLGKVISSSPDIGIADRIVAISIPGDDFQLKAAITDEDGEFYIDVFQKYTKPLIIAQLIDGDREGLKVQITEEPSFKFVDLKFKKFSIDSTMKKSILKRSIHNQIENAYFEARPDTLITSESDNPFWGSEVEEYNLDDYTRFPTLIETMVEIMPFASIRRDGPDNFIFNVRLFDTYEGPEQGALVFIDGMLITSHKRIVELDSKIIEQIMVVRDKFELAGKGYRGLINIKTFNKDYFETTNEDYLTKLQLRPPGKNKKYFKQHYGLGQENDNNNVPDYRYQLLWEPNVKLEGSGDKFDFFTSDVPGIYEIKLEGFSIYGRPVSLHNTITVE
ncbi:hypothetical protein [Maribacter sp. HTCC2170]|uniref:hypothetical protein n=1 Tax=Maribacter sp. (strain HTCC2170 / KCCM 42371) TaxID=313603 RepID=UPI00006AFD24|nr:hypothetical protein [Maribacter sp. HTCC2170]EAR01526.1 hypothetical protein FB2170_12416 [Maribacter sp. HTCC2170]